MITIVIPTLNAATHLPACLNSVVEGAICGLVKELVVVDGGSQDATIAIADEAGANIIQVEKGRGGQLQQGGNAAKADWVLFLHADTVLAEGWIDEVKQFIENPKQNKAAVFRFALDDPRWRARILETIVKIRCLLLALPYGDQGLLISKKLYNDVGGYKSIVLMEDVDIIGRIGRQRLHFFKTAAVTGAERYKRDGYVARMARNLKCLSMWFLGVAPEKILGKYK